VQNSCRIVTNPNGLLFFLPCYFTGNKVISLLKIGGFMTDLNYSFTAVSQNSKTGNIAVTSTSSASCPSACPFIKTVISDAVKKQLNGCYADYSYTGIQWRALDKHGIDFAQLLSSIRHLDKGAKLRLNVMGDLPHKDQTILVDLFNQLVDIIVKRQLNTILYSHHDLSIESNLIAFQTAFDRGLHVNASCENIEQARSAIDNGINAVIVLPVDSIQKTIKTGDVRIVRCPNEYNDRITCSNCMLCAKDRTQNRVIIGFTAHGTGKTKVSNAVIEANRKYQTKA
jgi:hypothetical protein